MICSVCIYNNCDLKTFLLHIKKHRNDVNLRINCPICYCPYTKVDSLRQHLSRFHANFDSTQTEKKNVCAICKVFIADSVENMIKHICKTHFSSNVQVKCPILGCERDFKTSGSFRLHLPRYHGKLNKSILKHDYDESYEKGLSENVSNVLPCDVPVDDFHIESQNEEYFDLKRETENFTLTAAKFFMKIQSIDLIPVIIIDKIIKEFFDLHEQSISIAMNNSNINDWDKNNDPFVTVFGPKGSLRTNRRRMKFYEQNLGVHYPIEEYLFTNVKNKKIFNYIIRPSDIIKGYLSTPSLKEDLESNLSKLSSESPIIMKNSTDGSLFRNNSFFQLDKALAIILFQDAFTATSPLGSSAKDYKIIGTYMTLANFSPSLRMGKSTIRLVNLITENTLKRVGKKLAYQTIINDIGYLETDGIVVEGKLYKASLFMVCSDNLGAHEFSGHLESFGPNVSYCCRFCLIKGEDLRSNKIESINDESHKKRDPNDYENALAELEATGKSSVRGIKDRCIFNAIYNFHCAAPAMAPCVGHDLFEGIVQYDMKLMIQYFINKNYFSLNYLNDMIMQISLKGSDAKIKLKTISRAKMSISSSKLGGEAVQNWTLLRFFPILIGDKIPKDDECWKMLLKLREMVSLVMLREIPTALIPSLKSVVEDYMIMRLNLFNSVSIKSKHHFICHYAYLSEVFGPLSKCWTLNFESYHQTMKKCFTRKRNYINPIKTMSINAEIAEAFFRSDITNDNHCIFADGLIPINNKKFEESRTWLKAKFNGTIRPVDLQFVSVAKSVSFRKITYKKNVLIDVLGMMNISDEIDLVFIKEIFFYHPPIKAKNEAYFRVTKQNYVKDESNGIYFHCNSSTSQIEDTLLVLKEIDNFSSLYELYDFKGRQCIIPY